MKKYESPIMEKVEFIPQDNMTVSTQGVPTLPTKSEEEEQD